MQKKKNYADYLLILIMALALLGSCTTSPDIKASQSPDLFFGQYLMKEISYNRTFWRLYDVYLPDHSAFQNQVMQYAYKYKDKEFLYMLKAECGDISPDCLGDNGHAHGFCPIHDYYHPQIVNDPRFKDWKWQIDQCYKLWKGGTRFYGYDHRNKVTKFFKFYD